MKSIKWKKGMQITEGGIYEGIPLEEYHGNRALFDGPAVSKSNLKYLLPEPYGVSPKAFWGRWKWNPNKIEQKSNDALNFGKATHTLLLGDEVFEEHFDVRPDHRVEDLDKPVDDRRKWNLNASDCKEWMTAREKAGLTVITNEQLDLITAMAADAAQNHYVKNGILNGAVERTFCAKDPETGIWMTSRPDAWPLKDGTFSDLKTAASLNQEAIQRQISDAGYYLQGGMTKMVCDALGLPFQEFWLVYVLKDDIPDTAAMPLSPAAIDRGERSIRWCLRTIRQCLDANEWPGARPFNDGNEAIYMKPWDADKIDKFLDQEERAFNAEKEAA